MGLVVSYVFCAVDCFYDRCGFGAFEVVQGGGRNQLFQGLEIIFLKQSADCGGADRLIHGFFTGDDGTFYAGRGKFLCHDLIVNIGYLAAGLFAYVTAGDGQGFGDSGENLKVQLCMAFYHGLIIFQKITRIVWTDSLKSRFCGFP